MADNEKLKLNLASFRETIGTVNNVITRFLQEIMEDTFQPANIGIKRTKEEAVEILGEIYRPS